MATQQRSARILRRMTPGTMGGQSRVASAPGFGKRATSVTQQPSLPTLDFFEVAADGGQSSSPGPFNDLIVYYNIDGEDSLGPGIIGHYNVTPTADWYYIQTEGVFRVQIELDLSVTSGAGGSTLQLRWFGPGAPVVPAASSTESSDPRHLSIDYEWTITPGDLVFDAFGIPSGPASVVWFSTQVVNDAGVGVLIEATSFMRVTALV